MALVRDDVDPEVVIASHESETRIQRRLDSARHDKDCRRSTDYFPAQLLMNHSLIRDIRVIRGRTLERFHP